MSHVRNGTATSGHPDQSICTISRLDLMETVGRVLANIECADSTKEKLFAVAEMTDAVAVGWWHCDGVSCPARQARRKNQAFQTGFDRAMAERFGRDWDEENTLGPFEPFVVVVEGCEADVPGENGETS